MDAVRTDNLGKLLGREVEVAPVPFTGRYPTRAVRWEATKAGIGIAACLGVMLYLNPTAWIAWPLAIIAVLFGLYLWQQLTRLRLSYRVDASGITREQGGQRTALHWQELTDMRLNYYPDGRKASTGMLVLVLRNGQQRFKVDSSLDHFPGLLARAAEAARERGLELHPTTQANLSQLDL